MRLIDADELKRKYAGWYNIYGKNKSIRCLEVKEIDWMPTIDSVPLEPLCVWLAGYAAPPNYALDEVRDDSIDPESLVYTANDRAKAWEYHFREMLKSGLMDTEGEDARP